MDILGKTREERDAQAKQRYYNKHPEKVKDFANKHLSNNDAETAREKLREDVALLDSTKYTAGGIAQKKQQDAVKNVALEQQRVWATENAMRIKYGLPLEIIDGKIYSFEPLTKDILQKSIDWADSDIARYKEKGGHSSKIGEWADKLLTYTGHGDNSKDRFETADDIEYYSELLRDRESKRAVYQQYLENAEYEEAIAEIKRNGDSSLFRELYDIDSKKPTLMNALPKVGSGGFEIPEPDILEDAAREAEIKAELQKRYGDSLNKYRELYAKGVNDELKAYLVDKLEDTLEEHPVLGTVAYTLGNVVTAPVRGIGAVSDSINKAMGNYGASSGSVFQDMSEVTVHKVNENINNTFQNEYAAGFVRSVYNAAVSGAESMLAMGTFGKLGEAILGLNAATSTYKAGKERGLSDGQALANGIAAGIFETLFEHMSLENLRIFKTSPTTSLKPFIKNVLKQSGMEGLEEFGTDLANEAYDYLVNGGLSQYEEALRSGMTAEEYGKQFGLQLLETAATGALSGGGMIAAATAPTAVRGSVNNLISDRASGRFIRQTGEVEETLKNAKETGGLLGGKAKRVEKKLSDGNKVSDRTLGEIERKTLKKERAAAVDKILATEDFRELSGKEKNAIRSSVLSYFSLNGQVSYEQAEVLKTENGKKALRKTYEWAFSKAETKTEQAKERKTEEIRTAVSEGNTERLVKNSFEAVNSDGYKVEIGAVRNITDGEFEIVQDKETGATAKLSELRIEDEEINDLYSELQKSAAEEIPMTVEAVNVALSMYNPYDNTSGEAYAKWAYDAFKAGSLKINDTVLTFSEYEEMMRGDVDKGESNYTSDITISQLRQMYEIGVRNLVTKPGVTKIGIKGLTNFQAEQVFIIDQIAKKYGLEIVLVDNRLKDPDGRGINGYYKSGTNRIVLSLQSELDLVMVTAGHELFHWAKEQNKYCGDYLQRVVIGTLKSDAKYNFDKIYNEVSAVYQGLSEDEILEEIAAQYLGVALSNKATVKRIVDEANTTEKTFLEKLISHFKEFIGRIKKLLDIYGSTDATVKAAVSTPVAELKEIARQFEVALSEAAKNKKPATEDGGVKFSLKVTPTTDEINKNIKIVSNMKPVSILSGNEFQKGDKNLIIQVEKYFDSVGGKVSTAYGDIELRRKGIKSSLGHGMGRNKAVAFKAVPEVLKKGKIIDYQKNWKNRGYDTVVFAAPISIAEQEYFMASVVVVEATKNDYYLHEVLLQKKEDDALFKTGTTKSGTSGKASSPIFILLEKLNEVNKKDTVKNSYAEIGAKTADIKTEQGYKKEASQLINANSPDATTEYGSAILSNSSVTQNAQTVNNNDMQKEKKDTKKYSVKRDVDGNKFVDVDPDLFDSRDGESHAKTIARIIKERFNNLISVNGQQIQINKTTNDEWRRSNGADALRNRDSQGYFDKLKTIPYADEIMKAAKNWIGEELHHPRKDDISEFARGNVYYRVGNNGYVADVIVAIRKNGAAVLYDLDDIREKTITDVSLTMASESPQRSAETSVTDNITQSDTDVKKKYSRQRISETEDNISQMKAENESFFQYLERLGDKIGEQIKTKRTPGSDLIYDRKAFYEIAKKYNLLDSESGGWFKSSKYSDTELVNVMENIMVGISDGLISPKAGLSRLARIQEDILRTGYELKYGNDRNGQAIKEDVAKAFKQDIRNKPIYVSHYTYDKLMEQYKTKKNLRSASFNQLSIREEDSSSNPNIEFLYGEMLEKYPELLNEVTEPLDMINELISSERAVHPQIEYISDKEGFRGFVDLSEAAVRRAADMLTEAFNVELIQGDLNKQYEELRGVRQTLDRTKKYYSGVIRDAAKIRAEREQKGAELKRVIRITRRLDKMLRKETDYKHIPEGLKQPVAKFLQIIKGSITNSFGESLIDTSLSLAELNKAYEAYGYEDTMHSDESYAEKLSQLQFVLHGDKRLKDLSLNELETVTEIVTHFNFLVNEGNKTFVDTQKRGYEHVASVSTEEVFAHKENRKKGLEKIKDAEYHMLTPYMFFKMIGTRFEGSQEVTEVLGELGNALLKGEEKTARNAEKVKEITQQIMAKHGYDSRWLSDKKDYVFKSGQTASMTTENIMHTLAVYDREEASGFKTDHIFAGGIVVNESAHKAVSDYIKPIPETIKTRNAFRKAQKERKDRLQNNNGKIFVGMTDAERAKVLKKTALPVVDATNVILKDDLNGQVDELKKKYEGSSFKVVRELGEKFGVFKDYTNENVQLEVNYSIGSAKKSINEAEKNGEDINDFAKMLSIFDDVIKNAQPVEVHKDKYKGTKKENTNLKQVYVLLSAFQDGNSIVPVEFVVKEYKERNKNQLYVSVNLKRIEAEVPKAGKENPRNTFRPTSVFRLTDIISNVNPLDSEFLKYIPASMLNEQQVVGRNEGIRKEKLRIAEIERTGDVNVSAEVTEDEQKALAAKIAERMRVYISKEDIDMLRDQLTPMQKAYYKALVSAMSKDGADMGNETSMMLSGTKKFTEKAYCPFSVVSDYLLERFGSKDVSERRLKNRSFTKRITENANAPILIDNMSEVYAKHMYEMCTYNGMTIPLESIERLLNYKLPDEYEAVGDKIQVKKGKSYRELFREAFGDRGLQYLENLMRDLNGGIKVDNRGALNSMISNFKRSAVSASLTVAMQQPGAVGRAMFRIDPQYFMPTLYIPSAANLLGKYTNKAEFLDRYDELLKYCPLAVIKDVGKFDTNVGQSFEDWILDIKPKFHSDKSIKGVIKGLDMWLPGAKGKLEDAMMWLPGYLDRATWLHIWNAVKRETAHKNGVKVNRLTEKQLAEAGERMTQVIRETQVYDSVLSRSDLMRSKSALAQMATSFMAEPTVTYNMMRYAAVTAKHQPKVLVRAIASVLCSVVLTDLLKNFAEAVRYDDEETDFAELLLSGTVVDFINDLNPLTYIPYVKDIWSMFEGYDIERVDMSVFSKVIDALKPFIDSEKEAGYEEWEQLIVTLSMFTGIPINNLWKDITGIKAKFKRGSPKFSIDAVGNSIKSELSENPFIKLAGKLFPPIYYFFDMSDEKIIYNAILNDDESVLDRYRLPMDEDIEDIIDQGYSEADAILKATDNAESNFHSKVVEGLISEDSRIEEAAEARLSSDTKTYEELLEELTGLGFDRNDVITAIDKYIASMEDKTYKKSVTKDKATYTYDDLYRAIDADNMNVAKTIFDSLTEGVEKETVQENIRDEYAEDIYNAILKGNNTEKQRLIKMFGSFDYDYNYAVILGLRENDERVLEAAKARYDGDTAAYERIKTDIVADGFDENDVFSAIKTETEKLSPDKEDDEPSSPETSYLYEPADLRRYAENRNLAATKKAIQNFRDCGKEDGDIRKELTSVFKKKYIEAWLKGDDTTVITIRDFLGDCDVGYTSSDFSKWEKEALKK